MLKRLIMLVAVIMGFVMLMPQAQAQSGDATVSTSGLNVRAIPGTNAKIVGTLDLGVSVTVAGREDQQGNGGIWVLVTPVGGGTTGWVLSNYLNFNNGRLAESFPVIDPSTASTSSGSTQTTTTTQTTTNNVAPGSGMSGTARANANVRSGPGTTFARIGGVNAGSTVTIVGRSADSGWLYGNIGGTTGWISASLIRLSGNITALAVVDSNGATVTPGTTTTTTTTTPSTTAGNPAPVTGGGGFAGFAYGAHVANFNNPDVMQRTGMTWAKIQVRYSWGDDPNSHAGTIALAHSQGFKILLGVVGHTHDVANGGDNYFNAFAAFTAGLAAAGADAIEVWNEPNLDREWPNGMIDAGRYTRLLALSYNAIKGANRNTMVISGAPAPTGFFGGCQASGCDDAVYVAGMRAAGAASYMDCMGAHYNEGIVAPSVQRGDPRSEFYTRYFWGMVNTYRAAINKPLCFTELGYVTPEGYGGMPPGFEWGNSNSLAEQATWIADAISLAANSGGKIKLVIIWNLNFSTPAGAADPAGGYAMIRPDGSCPACDVLASRR